MNPKAIILPLAAFCMSAVFAQKPQTVGQWQAIYDKATKAFDKMDAKGVEQFMTPDWKALDTHGKPEATGATAVEREFQAFSSIHVTFQVLSVKKIATGYLVRNNFSMDGKSKPDKNGKTHVLSQKGVGDDTWISQNGKWLMKESRNLKESLSIDGKPVGPTK